MMQSIFTVTSKLISFLLFLETAERRRPELLARIFLFVVSGSLSAAVPIEREQQRARDADPAAAAGPTAVRAANPRSNDLDPRASNPPTTACQPRQQHLVNTGLEKPVFKL